MPIQLNRATIEEVIRAWCHTNGCTWGHAYLFDSKGWDARRAADSGTAGLPSADWVLSVAGSGLFDVLNHTYPDRGLYDDLLSHLHRHGLTLDILMPRYARVIPSLREKSGLKPTA